MSSAPVILLGMNNPLSDRPDHALFPHPPGCTGHRLWKMLNAVCGASRGEYCSLSRTNLLHDRRWHPAKARQAARQFKDELCGRYPVQAQRPTVLVFGAETWRLLDLPDCCELVHPVVRDGITWRRLPHPSGRNLWYNDPNNRLVVGLLLEEALRG